MNFLTSWCNFCLSDTEAGLCGCYSLCFCVFVSVDYCVGA